MRKGWWVLALALLLAASGGELLPRGRELEERKLISALALDGGEGVTATAVTAVRATGEEEPEVLRGTGESLAAACRVLRGESVRRAYLGQTEQLLLGEAQDPEEALRFVLKDRELRLDTLLYIVRGSAGEGLGASAELVSGETGGRDPRGRTVGELLPRLTEGERVLVPALAPGEDGALAPAGWAVLGPGGVEGWLEGEAALGAELLLGLGPGQVVSLPHGAVELTAARTWAMDGTLRCTLTARAVEGDPRTADLADWGRRVLTAALAPGWDCWGLERQLGALRPGDWEVWRDHPVEELYVRVTGKLVES